MEDRRCTARSSRTGEPCKRSPIKGATVCASHGGSAPQVREAAHRRLLEAVDPVVAELVALALDSQDDRVRLQACRDLLDRVGIREPVQVQQISLSMVEAEIARLERELAIHDDESET